MAQSNISSRGPKVPIEYQKAVVTQVFRHLMTAGEHKRGRNKKDIWRGAIKKSGVSGSLRRKRSELLKQRFPNFLPRSLFFANLLLCRPVKF